MTKYCIKMLSQMHLVFITTTRFVFSTLITSNSYEVNDDANRVMILIAG